jgi:hypothetical protein
MLIACRALFNIDDLYFSSTGRRTQVMHTLACKGQKCETLSHLSTGDIRDDGCDNCAFHIIPSDLELYILHSTLYILQQRSVKRDVL